MARAKKKKQVKKNPASRRAGAKTQPAKSAGKDTSQKRKKGSGKTTQGHPTQQSKTPRRQSQAKKVVAKKAAKKNEQPKLVAQTTELPEVKVEDVATKETVLRYEVAITVPTKYAHRIGNQVEELLKPVERQLPDTTVEVTSV